MDGNPFLKSSFSNLRDWEAELVFFCLEQLKEPNAKAWYAFADNDLTRHVAGFVAFQLANFAYVRRLAVEAPLRDIALALLGKPVGWADLNNWFCEKWLDQSRFFDTLETAIKTGVTRETHRLTV